MKNLSLIEIIKETEEKKEVLDSMGYSFWTAGITKRRCCKEGSRKAIKCSVYEAVQDAQANAMIKWRADLC